MFNSKLLKSRKFRFEYENDYEDGKMNFVEKLGYFVRKFLVWPICDNYRIYKDRTGRSWQFARIGWQNYDWDFHYVYRLLEWKLARVYKALKDGNSIQEKEDMVALKRLIKITHRLSSGRYEDKYHDQHNEKWGEIQTKSTPYEFNNKGKPTMYRYESWRDSTLNASDVVKEQERKEFLECYEKADADRCADIDKLAESLKKYSNKWWD